MSGRSDENSSCIWVMTAPSAPARRFHWRTTVLSVKDVARDPHPVKPSPAAAVPPARRVRRESDPGGEGLFRICASLQCDWIFGTPSEP
ncbi:hypothetical protein GCM10029992_63750 [Glycomyces albus]